MDFLKILNLNYIKQILATREMLTVTDYKIPLTAKFRRGI